MSDAAYLSDSGSPEQTAADAAEAAKVEQAKAEVYEERSATPPDNLSGENNLILGKYQSQEELVSAYQNLQREYTRLKGGDGQVDSVPEQEPQATQEAPAPQSDPGPELTEETVATLTSSLFDAAGGEAEYQRLASWAANNLDGERINAFNDTLNKGDVMGSVNALKAIQYDFTMRNGFEPQLTGGRAPANDVKGFSSRYEITQAMSDRRYAQDSAFRREVEARMAATPDSLFNI